MNNNQNNKFNGDKKNNISPNNFKFNNRPNNVNKNIPLYLKRLALIPTFFITFFPLKVLPP